MNTTSRNSEPDIPLEQMNSFQYMAYRINQVVSYLNDPTRHYEESRKYAESLKQKQNHQQKGTTP